ncbi:MAG: hypothetical protein HY738_16085 [Bacteroidia bacterium]|nr:hypothetical protein [Bacteroidia bacterium]
MELFLNELSANYPVASHHAAKARMDGLISLFKKTKEEGFILCRFPKNFETHTLFNDYTVLNWLNDSAIKKDLKDFYLSYRKYPFETGIEEEENNFIVGNYILNEPQETRFNGAITEGLAWAFICDTLAISFPANIVWQKTSINLIEDKNGNRNNVTVNHASEVPHFAVLQNWINSIKTITLSETQLLPNQKSIHISDDHGKDKLEKIAKKLCRSVYVTEIPYSLPLHPHTKCFINKVYHDGKIAVTLFDYDEGFSMMVQTTGKNLRETQTIAEILKDMY